MCYVYWFNTNGISLLYFVTNPTNIPFFDRGYHFRIPPPVVGQDLRHILENSTCEYLYFVTKKLSYRRKSTGTIPLLLDI